MAVDVCQLSGSSFISLHISLISPSSFSLPSTARFQPPTQPRPPLLPLRPSALDDHCSKPSFSSGGSGEWRLGVDDDVRRCLILYPNGLIILSFPRPSRHHRRTHNRKAPSRPIRAGSWSSASFLPAAEAAERGGYDEQKMEDEPLLLGSGA